jgi:molybdate transport system substrate-binding protein
MKAMFKPVLLLALMAIVVRPSGAVPVRVYADASVTEAFREICDVYSRTHRNDPIDFTLAGSADLRTKVLEGAPVDVFVSAGRTDMDILAAQHLVAQPQVFARNSMVVVVPARSGRVIMIHEMADKGIRVALADSKTPAGRCADYVLAKMTPAIEDNFAKHVLANVASRESDAQSVLAKVESGKADAGIVFSTDALSDAQRVRVIVIRPELNVTAEYSIAVLTRSFNPRGAASFISFVMSPDAQEILREHGFLSPAAK